MESSEKNPTGYKTRLKDATLNNASVLAISTIEVNRSALVYG
jgi:hypothetical protein